MTLWPTRAAIPAEAYATATRAYAALQESDAETLAALGAEPSAELPYLAAALRRLLQERPWAGPGLARSERQILRAVADGARTPVEIFLATSAWRRRPTAATTGSSSASTTSQPGRCPCSRRRRAASH